MEGLSKALLVGQALEDAAARAPEALAYVFFGRKINFRELDEASNRLAMGFLNAGIKKGDRIGIIALNQPQWLYSYFAAAKIGAAVVGLSPRHPKPELKRLLNQSRPTAMVSLKTHGDMDYVDFFSRLRKNFKSPAHCFFIGGEGFAGSASLESLLETEVDLHTLGKAKALVQPDDKIMFAFTSGTTGHPKAAAISHKSQLASARAQALHIRLKEQDLSILTMPLSHVGGITIGALSMLLARAGCILIPVFLPEEVIRQASEYNPTIMGGFPTMHTMLMMHEGFKGLDTSGVRLIITGGSNAEPEMVKNLHKSYPESTLMNMYGLSETSGGAIMSPWNCGHMDVARTIGKPLGDFKIKIVGMEGQTLAKGETGEIYIKGDCVVTGYFRQPEETNKAIDQNGWLCTGDMAYLDDEGFIVLMGRRTEMYIQEGLNVYPVEVEDMLSTHPKVSMAAGIGVPDPVYGEVGRYYIVAQNGTDPTEEELKRFCVQNVADYKVPMQIVFRSHLPMTPLGKIKKSELRLEFEKTGK